MEQETEQFVRAIVIAADPSQGALHKQAIEYLQTIQANVAETWQLALSVFVAQGPDGTRRHPVEARFFALKVLDEFLDNKYVVRLLCYYCPDRWRNVGNLVCLG